MSVEGQSFRTLNQSVFLGTEDWALITLCRLMVFKKKKKSQKWASVMVRHLVTYLFKLFILM